MRNPTAVATDGTIVAVADTDNNRVLIWNQFPTTNDQPANLVLGQPDFNTVQSFAGVHNKTLRGPQGVWIQNGKLFVADTQNHRVLIWNSIPTKNDQAADVVLGQKDFNSAVCSRPPAVLSKAPTNRLLSPTSVTSDGTHAVRGRSWLQPGAHLERHSNRATIQPADVVIGQAEYDRRCDSE